MRKQWIPGALLIITERLGMRLIHAIRNQTWSSHFNRAHTGPWKLYGDGEFVCQ